jgi:predicted RNase H-like HicB family nuclease
MMTPKVQLAALIEREGDVYVATCPELSIASQGDNVAEARANLAEALQGWFEAASEAEIGESLDGAAGQRAATDASDPDTLSRGGRLQHPTTNFQHRPGRGRCSPKIRLRRGRRLGRRV